MNIGKRNTLGARQQAWLWALLICCVTWAAPAQANTWNSSGNGTQFCSGCHGEPPTMLSQSAPSYLVGKIIPKMDDGALSQNCATTVNCALRLKIQNNVNMGSTITANYTGPELEGVRQYLLQVRDGVVSAPSPAPVFADTAVLAFVDSTFNLNVSNYRSRGFNYLLNVVGGNSGDFSIQTSSLSGAGCSTPSIPAATVGTPAICTLAVTVRFQPTTTGPRASSLKLTLNAADAADADANDTASKNIALSGTGTSPTAPGFQMLPSTLSFNTTVNTTVTQQTTITNTGTANLVLGTLNFAAPYSRDATSGCNSGSTVTPGGNCVLKILFAPTAVGPFNAASGIPHNATGSPSTLTLNGTGTAVPPGTLGAPASQGFGSVTVGSSGAQTITLSHSGSAPINFSSFVLSGAQGSEFPISGGTCVVGTPLTTGNTCNITMNFTPAAAGARVAVLTINSNASNPAVNVSLSGTGVAAAVPVFSIGSTTLSFSTVANTAVTSSTTISNSGTGTLNLTALPITGAFASDYSFAPSNSCTTSTALTAGLSCNLVIQFLPTAAGTRNASLGISHSAAGSPVAVALNGTTTALPEPTVSPNPLPAFPATLVGVASSTPRILTISNPRATAVVYSTAFTGANAADFGITSESCATHSVPSGGTCTLTVQFTPQAAAGAGARSGSLGLTFTGGATAPLPVSVGLSGTANVAAPVFSLGSSALAFSAVVGTPGPASTTISNTGNAPLNLTALTLGGGFASEYSFAPTNTCTAGGTVAAGASCSLVLNFAPVAAGSRPASLSITHNAVGSPSSVSLNGIATAGPQPAIDLGGVSALPFGSVAIGSSAPQSFTVRNIGTAPLNISAFNLSGSAAGEFTRSGSCAVGTPLAAAGSCGVTLSFAPTTVGARTALLTIVSDASNVPPATTVSLSGDGAALAEPVLSPLPLDPFPATLAGTTSAITRVLTIQNPRSSSITYARSFVGTHLADFVVAAESCASRLIPAGSACTISLQFTPSAAGGVGARSASLNLSFIGSSGEPNPAAVSVGVSGNAAAPTPVFSINNTALGFATVLGTSTTRSAVVTNTGSANLALAGLTFSGTAASEFGLAASNTCTAGLLIAPSSSCSLVLQFTPVAAGTSLANLAITHNALGSPQSVALTGTATALPQARIEFSALAVAFASTALGASTQQSITVQNTGGADLVLSALTLGGAAPGDFSRAGTCSTSTVLAAGAQCTLLLTFQPTAVGGRSASLNVRSNASNGDASLALTGTGLPAPAPALGLAPAALDFGTQAITGNAPARRVVVSNLGAAPLTISSITVSGLGFAIAPTSSCTNGTITLVFGASCNLDIAFTPGLTGVDYTGNVSFASNAAGSPQGLALRGRASVGPVPSLSWSPATTRLDFGAVVAGAVSATQTLTLNNAGPAAATLGLLNAIGADAAAFSVTTSTCPMGVALLAAGQSCQVDIRFAPASAGAKTATVQLVSNGSGPPELVLVGTGLGGPSPGLAVSETTVNFEGTRVGAQSLPATVTLVGSGSGVVRITGISASTGFVMQNKTCPATPFTLPAGSECSVTVTFVPQGEGAASGSLTINTDATPAQRAVALNAQGEKPANVAGGGGCSLSQGQSATDPTLWALVLLAAAVLWRRRLKTVDCEKHKKHVKHVKRVKP
jgi:trimeric autotransporter adhesin